MLQVIVVMIRTDKKNNRDKNNGTEERHVQQKLTSNLRSTKTLQQNLTQVISFF